jgi:hypothetical protein
MVNDLFKIVTGFSVQTSEELFNAFVIVGL